MKPTSDHKHRYIKPLARLANPDKGLFFLLWVCSCGKERAGDLLTRDRIEEIRKQYKQRVADKTHPMGDSNSVLKG